jgi:hypothetical protein
MGPITTLPTTSPIKNTLSPAPVKTMRPTSGPTSQPVLNGLEGDYCLYNDTCISRVCANSHQSESTVYHNTCLPNNLPKGSVCYNDESCNSYSCSYNWSFDKYICN